MDERAGGVEITPDELERERLLTYVEWAAQRTPPWYWPLFAVATTGWIASFELGTTAGVAVTAVASVVLGLMAYYVTSIGGVSTPRFRGMPGPLRRAFLPIAVIGLAALVAVIVALGVVDDPPFLLLGLVIGLLLTLSGAWSTAWYRRAARRAGAAAGLAWPQPTTDADRPDADEVEGEGR